MFERFTQDSRDVVVGAQGECRALGHDGIDTAHLLLSLVAGTSPAADLLREHGVTHEGGVAALHTVLKASPGRQGELASADDDAAALAALGVDLERIRASLEASFGVGALERAARRPPDRRRPGLPSLLGSRRRGPRDPGHRAFTPDARKTMELSLREAARLGDGFIGAEHVLLGLLRGHETAAVLTLGVLGVDPEALRHEVETGRRRSA